MPRSVAEKFTDFFDSDWSTTQKKSKGTLRVPEIKRFEETSFSCTSTCRPLSLDKRAIVELEKWAPGFDALNLNRDTISSTIPLTNEQEELGMTKSVAPVIPLKTVADSNNQTVLFKKHEAFENYQSRPPSFECVTPPAILSQVGQEMDRKVRPSVTVSTPFTF
jgi:hypothetical protein